MTGPVEGSYPGSIASCAVKNSESISGVTTFCVKLPTYTSRCFLSALPTALEAGLTYALPSAAGRTHEDSPEIEL